MLFHKQQFIFSYKNSNKFYIWQLKQIEIDNEKYNSELLHVFLGKYVIYFTEQNVHINVI